MSVVLNEREWAEHAIATRELGKKPGETLGRIARYYYQCGGYKKKDIRGKLEDFLLQCNPDVILLKWENIIDRVVRSAGKYPLIELDGVDVTQSELDAISVLSGAQIQRIAFTLLCVAKYWNSARKENNDWVNVPDREILKMANVSTSVQRQNGMFHELKNAGLIRFGRRVDNLNIRVLFIDNDSPVALHIDDFRNLGNQYMLYSGGPYFKCEHCGLAIRKKNNAHRYCPDCASEMYIQKTVESVMRNRGNQREFSA